MDTEVVGGVEAEVGKETGIGEGTIVGNNSGMTGTETETGTRGMAVTRALQTPTRDTTPRDHIPTIIDLYSVRCFQYSKYCNLICEIIHVYVYCLHVGDGHCHSF